MPYIIETWGKEDHAAVRQQHRPAHLAFLEAHKHLLLACGARLQDDGRDAGGGLHVADLATKEEAERFIAADPFTRAGLFRQVTITRWRRAYLDGRSFL